MALPTLNLQELERLAIREALDRTGGKVAKAAALLGIGRATLYRRLNHSVSQPRVDPRQLPLAYPEETGGKNRED